MNHQGNHQGHDQGHDQPGDAADPGDVGRRLAAVRGRLGQAARDAGRDPASVTLVAVAKTQPAAAVLAACVAGQRIFGENRVQEAAAKYTAARARYPDLVLHLIGPLQTNKVKQAVALFDIIETVDREKLAAALAAASRQAAAAGAVPPRCLIQVNVGREPQKAGVMPEEADGFIRHCRDGLGLPVRGLMCIPPAGEEPAPYFAFLAELARRNGVDQLSIGMSADFEVAIQQGATHVRVGTAIFGTRATA